MVRSTEALIVEDDPAFSAVTEHMLLAEGWRVAEAVERAGLRGADHPYTGVYMPTPVCGDAGRLDQVVVNLLDNAIRHTLPGTPITVRVETVADQARLCPMI